MWVRANAGAASSEHQGESRSHSIWDNNHTCILLNAVSEWRGARKSGFCFPFVITGLGDDGNDDALQRWMCDYNTFGEE